MGLDLIDPDLVGWTFQRREIANGYWKVDGWHVDGRSVSRGGDDPETVLAEVKA